MELLQIRDDDNLERLYDGYVMGRSECMLYYSSKYKKFIKELLVCEEEYLIVLDEDGVQGILPLMYAERDGMRVYNSLPYYGSHGGIIANHLEAEQILKNAYNDIASRETTISSTIVQNPFFENSRACIRWNYTDSRIGQITAIDSNGDAEEQIMSRLESRARGSIRKAMREGVMVERDSEQLNKLGVMHCQNMKEISGQAKSAKFFKLVPQYFIAEHDFDVYVAKKDGAVIAALLLFYFNHTVEYYVPAVEREFRSLQPMALILITAMVDASRRGYQFWNWGGTWISQDNVYYFKRQWAAEDYPYHYLTYLNHSDILSWSLSNILQAYPNFYVIPFSALSASTMSQ